MSHEAFLVSAQISHSFRSVVYPLDFLSRHLGSAILYQLQRGAESHVTGLARLSSSFISLFSSFHLGRFACIFPPSYSHCLFNPPSYTLATLSCHILGETKLGIGAPEYCCGGIWCEFGGRFTFGISGTPVGRSGFRGIAF